MPVLPKIRIFNGGLRMARSGCIRRRVYVRRARAIGDRRFFNKGPVVCCQGRRGPLCSRLMAGFHRGRKPEDKEVRRRAILDAARELAREAGAFDLSLNELGRRSGVSKPNIYRYFESREDILFQLYLAEAT